MYIEWIYQFNATNRFRPLYHGIFYKNISQDTISFFYKGDYLQEVEINKNGIKQSEKQFPSSLSSSIPESWYIEHQTDDYLICDELALKLPDRKLLPIQELSFSPLYPNFDRPYHLTMGSFNFNKYKISHLGSFQIVCSEFDTVLWEKKCKGYLYTDIIQYQNSILFGTAQWNGYFYRVDLLSGKTLIEMPTGGTVGFTQEDHFCFFYRLGKRGELIKLNLEDGTISDSLTLPGQVTVDCPIAQFGNMVLTFMFMQERKDTYIPTICAVRVN